MSSQGSIAEPGLSLFVDDRNNLTSRGDEEGANAYRQFCGPPDLRVPISLNPDAGISMHLPCQDPIVRTVEVFLTRPNHSGFQKHIPRTGNVRIPPRQGDREAPEPLWIG